MSVIVKERPRQTANVEFRKPESTRNYVASGSYSKTEILIAVGGTAPATDTVIDLTGASITVFLKRLKAREIGGGVWEVDAEYDDTPDQFDLKFNIGVQTAKFHQALELIGVYDCINGGFYDDPAGSGQVTPYLPDLNGAIGVRDGKVNGVEVEIAKVEFTITIKRAYDSLAASYLGDIAEITPSVNDDVFSFVWKTQTFSFPRGSVLFRGLTSSDNSEGQTEFTYAFAYSKPLVLQAAAWDSGTTYNTSDRVTFAFRIFESTIDTNLNFEPVPGEWAWDLTFDTGDKIVYNGNVYHSTIDDNQGNRPDLFPVEWTDDGPVKWTNIGPTSGEFRIGNSDPITKEGWWYMDPYYRPNESGGDIVSRPTGVYIYRVYDYGDFTILDLF